MGEKMKIVIGYDGSDCALAALDDLQHAGLPEVAQAVVVSVAETSSPSNQQGGDDLHQSVVGEGIISATPVMTQEAYQLILIANEKIQQLFPHWEVSAAPNWGSPASCILAQAGLLKADLIVVGAQGHSLLGRFILGSTSHTVVAEARCSVRIGRGRTAEPASPLKLLIGADGSKGSDAALQAVLSRSWPDGTQARVVTAFELTVPPLASRLLAPAVNWINEDNEAEQGRARRLAEWAAQLLSKAHLQTSICLKAGNPKHALLKEAEDWQADCLFVGARGLNRLNRLLLGSVSTAVATRAHCSVEVVRGSWTEETPH